MKCDNREERLHKKRWYSEGRKILTNSVLRNGRPGNGKFSKYEVRFVNFFNRGRTKYG